METLHRGWSRWMSISWWHSRHHWSTFDWIWDGGQSALTSSLESSQSFSHWLFFFLVEISLFVVRSASALDVHTIFFCGFPFFSCAVTAHQKGRPPWRVRFPFWFCSYRLFVVVVVVVVVVNISFRFPLHFFFRKSSRRLSSFTFFLHPVGATLTEFFFTEFYIRIPFPLVLFFSRLGTEFDRTFSNTTVWMMSGSFDFIRCFVLDDKIKATRTASIVERPIIRRTKKEHLDKPCQTK